MSWTKIAAIAAGVITLVSVITVTPAWVLPIAVLILCVGLLLGSDALRRNSRQR